MSEKIFIVGRKPICGCIMSGCWFTGEPSRSEGVGQKITEMFQEGLELEIIYSSKGVQFEDCQHDFYELTPLAKECLRGQEYAV